MKQEKVWHLAFNSSVPGIPDSFLGFFFEIFLCPCNTLNYLGVALQNLCSLKFCGTQNPSMKLISLITFCECSEEKAVTADGWVQHMTQTALLSLKLPRCLFSCSLFQSPHSGHSSPCFPSTNTNASLFFCTLFKGFKVANSRIPARWTIGVFFSFILCHYYFSLNFGYRFLS